MIDPRLRFCRDEHGLIVDRPGEFSRRPLPTPTNGIDLPGNGHRWVYDFPLSRERVEMANRSNIGAGDEIMRVSEDYASRLSASRGLSLYSEKDGYEVADMDAYRPSPSRRRATEAIPVPGIGHAPDRRVDVLRGQQSTRRAMQGIWARRGLR
jgi:hypothetical protein